VDRSRREHGIALTHFQKAESLFPIALIRTGFQVFRAVRGGMRSQMDRAFGIVKTQWFFFVKHAEFFDERTL